MIKFFKKLFSLPFKVVSKNAKKTKMRPENNRKRIGKSLFFLAIAVFTIFIFRLVWLITVNHVAGINLKQYATYNYENTITTQAKRGTIYDRYGTPIAVDSSNYTIYVVLDKNQKDPNGNKLYADKSEFPRLTNFLHTQLGIDTDIIDTQLHNKKAKQVQFGAKGSNISLQKMQALQKEIDDNKLKGVGFLSSLARSYPMSMTGSGFASQFIGTARMSDSGTGLIGVDGLEKSFNSILSGSNGKETYQKDNTGHSLPGTTKTIKKVKNGSDVYTTLDARLQEQLETLMDGAASQSGAQQLSATLMTKDGQILATTQRPTYNQTNRSTADKQKYFTWSSLLYQAAYEPGSTMKTFLFASALDSGKLNMNETYDRTELKVYDNTIKDWDVNENDGQTLRPTVLTYADGFMMSSNVGMARIENNVIGYKTWSEYLKRFKFDLKTRTGLAGEQLGSMPVANPVSEAQSAFGQGISVTQMQMLRGWTAFANNGTMLQPHVVSQVVDPNDKTTLNIGPEVIGKPVSSKSVDTVLDLMKGVDDDPNWGTAFSGIGDTEQNPQIPQNSPAIQVNGQPAAVKTGTAQIASPTGGYITGLESNLYSMVAMYPAKNPKFIFYMTIKLPTKKWTLNYICRVANPMLTMAVSRESEIFQSPDASTITKAGKVKLANYVGKIPGDVADTLRREVLQPVIVGDTASKAGITVKAQSLKPGDKVGANTRVLLLTDGNPQMPDMYDWSKADVEQVAKWYNLKVTYNGSGDKVTSQNITPETTIKNGQSITITMGS